MKNYGALHTLLIDAAFIGGHAIWRLKRAIFRLPSDKDTQHRLSDLFRHSVICAGFKIPVVENPAMRATEMNQAVAQG